MAPGAARHRARPVLPRLAPVARYGGTRLVAREYYLGARPVRILVGWGPGAPVRNVKIVFLDDGTTTVRPFRGLTLAPRRGRNARGTQPVVSTKEATVRRKR